MKRALLSGILTAQIFLASSLAQPAQAPVEAARPFVAEQTAPGVYVVVGPYALANIQNAGQISNSGFIIGKNSVAVVDTGGSYLAGQRLRATIREKTDLPIGYVILTHDHPDHIFGSAAFLGDNAIFIGHKNLPEALRTHAEDYLRHARKDFGDAIFAGTRVVIPTVLVDSPQTIDLGDRPLKLEAWPPAHTNCDLTVLDEATGTWLMGDLIFAGHVPALDGNLNGWLAVLRQLEQRPAARIVPGHGPAAMPWPEAAQRVDTYLSTLRDDVRASIRAGETMQEAADKAARSERDKWELFDDFNRRNAIAAYHELEWE
ncbi:quinoprotein relay system zinc metallohydrolase 2 [Rhodoblastus sp.]|uniref:quinoprotein relay system zinc metallohydrolase 2 n=1 Tax=Rhodoblastus sp. TaxID=1962975 RepID=UPI0035AEB3AD